VGQQSFSSVKFQIIYYVDQQECRISVIRGVIKVVRISHRLSHESVRAALPLENAPSAQVVGRTSKY
jgi:hypothetical protein